MPHVQILSVEDKQIIALDLRRRLTRLGYAVLAMVGSGAKAMAQVHGPDLVLMDIGVPGQMTGLEADARIWEALKVPIVYVTASVDAQTLAQASTPQSVLAVRKPFDATQL
jgi:CheY-like chemotaxis protein